MCNFHWEKHHPALPNNIALIQLNTFTVTSIDINPRPVPYDMAGDLDSYSSSGTAQFAGPIGKKSTYIATAPDRSYAYCHLPSDGLLDIDAVRTHLCADCLTGLLDGLESERRNLEIAFINMDTEEVVIAEDGLSKRLDDFYLICTTKGDGLLVHFFYVPERENFIPVWDQDYMFFTYITSA